MNLTNNQKTLICTITLVLHGACSNAQKQVDLLDKAKISYSDANQNPVVARSAALELDNARRALSQANSVWKSGAGIDVVEHHAYLASKRAEIAVHRAAQLENDNKIEQVKIERQKAQLEVRMVEVDQAKREALALQKPVEMLELQHTERGLVMTLGDVLFEIGAAALAPEVVISIVKIAEFLHKYPHRSAKIEGHSDSNGNADSNFDLSVRRASEVRFALFGRVLIRVGLPPRDSVKRDRLPVMIPAQDANKTVGLK